MKKSLLLISGLDLDAVATVAAIGLRNNGFHLAIADTAVTSHTITYSCQAIAGLRKKRLFRVKRRFHEQGV